MSRPLPAQDHAAGKRRWRVSSWWHLVWLFMLVFQPAFDPSSGPGDWAFALGVVIVFLPLYGLGERRPGRVRWWCTVLVVLLGVVALPFNSGAAVLFVYAAAWAGRFEPPRLAQRWLLGLTGLLGMLALGSPVPMPYRLLAFAPPLVFVWVVGVTEMEDAERERATAELRVENRRIEHLATVSERERIARDLHDLLGHALTSVVVRAQLVQRLMGSDPARATAEAAEIEKAARDALAQVRGTVQGWRHVSLDDELEVARTALAAVDVALRIDRDPSVNPAPTVETALALALREAVTNIVRHADAHRCTVSIGVIDGEITLRVADDGRGAYQPEGGGLSGMRERITALGGRVEQAVRAGTTLTVRVPVKVAG